MFREYLSDQNSDFQWNSPMPGVQTRRFSFPNSIQETALSLPVYMEPFHFEVFFCLTGHLMFRTKQGASYILEAPCVLFLSDVSSFLSCRHSKDVSGILIAIDAKAAKESLDVVCSALGIKLDTEIVKKRMDEGNGSVALPTASWTQAFFETMASLPAETQEQYCVFKATELLYLLCADSSLAESQRYLSERYVSSLMLEIKAYLLDHLSEKNTIEYLSRKFSISSTFLKESFRQAFGSPVHSWLVEQRLNRACKLLCTTRMSVQEVAHSVGYEGMSQFNAVFKRRFGATPGQYRKMSKTVTFRPF